MSIFIDPNPRSLMMKYSFFFVIATFLYQVITKSSGPTMLEGLVFITLGVFLIPLAVGLPINVLKNIFLQDGWGAIQNFFDIVILPKINTQ